MSTSSSNNPWKLFSFVLFGVLIGLIVSSSLSGSGSIFAFFKPDEQKKVMKEYVKQSKENFDYYAKNTTKTEDSFYALGNKNASVKIVEYSDFECPYCHNFFTNTLGQLKDSYVKTGSAYFVYKDFPLSFHKNATSAAEAARCAGEQDQFFQMHDLLFNFGDMWTQEKNPTLAYGKMAKILGLKSRDFLKCMEKNNYGELFKKSLAEPAQLKADTEKFGTPAFYINGQWLIGAYPFESFQKIIDPLLKK